MPVNKQTDTTNKKPEPVTKQTEPEATNKKENKKEEEPKLTTQIDQLNSVDAPIKIAPKVYPIKSSEPDFLQDSSTWFNDKEFLKGMPVSVFERHEDDYFGSYSHYTVHEDMLKDRVRTGTYRQAFNDNTEFFKGKIVLDVGCGTGILSMFAAKAGAKHVYAVDRAHIADYAKEIVKTNKLDNVITIIKDDMNNIKLPEKVDVIVSEWMGYCLLYESMLDCVLDARDKFLKDDGILMPNRARMRIAAVTDPMFKIRKCDFWDDVYGVNMDILKAVTISEPVIDYMPPNQIKSDVYTFVEFDLKTVKKEDLIFANKYSLCMKEDTTLDALALWFDVKFGFFLR